MRRRSATIHVMAQAAHKAARNLARDFGEVEQLQSSRKGPGGFVSAAARRAEQIVRRELEKARPAFGFLMQSCGAVPGEDERRRWIVDPLGGAVNFLHGLPHFCISVALEENQEIIAGIIYDPIKDEMFTAEKGAGAFMNERRIRVSSRIDPAQSLIGIGLAPPVQDGNLRRLDAVASRFAGVRCSGAATLDLAYVAAGRLDGCLQVAIQPWELAAGIVMLREAGARIGRLEGDEQLVAKGTLCTGNIDIFTHLGSLWREAGALATDGPVAEA